MIVQRDTERWPEDRAVLEVTYQNEQFDTEATAMVFLSRLFGPSLKTVRLTQTGDSTIVKRISSVVVLRRVVS